MKTLFAALTLALTACTPNLLFFDGGSYIVKANNTGCLITDAVFTNYAKETRPLSGVILGLDANGNTIATYDLSCASAMPRGSGYCMRPQMLSGIADIGCGNIKSYRIVPHS